jgi:hypothetical protein
MATEPVLLNLQAHELLLGERLTEDLLQPDRIHSSFHPCQILRRHSCEIGIRRAALNAEIVAGASDVSRRPSVRKGGGSSRPPARQAPKLSANSVGFGAGMRLGARGRVCKE